MSMLCRNCNDRSVNSGGYRTATLLSAQPQSAHPASREANLSLRHGDFRAMRGRMLPNWKQAGSNRKAAHAAKRLGQHPDLENALAATAGVWRPKSIKGRVPIASLGASRSSATYYEGCNVRFPRLRTCRRVGLPPECAKTGHYRNAALSCYSITSSAMLSSPDETVRPSALAVFILITNSNLVGCWIGSSPTLEPLRIRLM